MNSEKRKSKRAALREYVEQRRPERIGEAEWVELSELLAPVNEGYLRKLIRDTDLELAPLVEGVRQDSFEELERTLLGLIGEYTAAVESGDRARAKTIRRAVISAKDHARFALARAGSRASGSAPDAVATASSGVSPADREEMILWMTTWLENPGVFPSWLDLRKRALTSELDHPNGGE